jgi:hypothetical protein
MNFRRAGVGEAGVNATGDQRMNQIFGSIHRSTGLSLSWLCVMIVRRGCASQVCNGFLTTDSSFFDYSH